jgi:hypothetical protein
MRTFVGGLRYGTGEPGCADAEHVMFRTVSRQRYLSRLDAQPLLVVHHTVTECDQDEGEGP